MDLTIIELVERSAELALERASVLREHLGPAGAEVGLTEARADLHQLIGDIVSMRNAAELMKQEFLADGGSTAA